MQVKALAIEAHIAQKLHAYSLPRDKANTRVRDLPDLGLLSEIRPIQSAVLREAIERTFQFRGTHEPPKALGAPPSEWGARYLQLARENDLRWKSLREVTLAVAAFLDPILGGAQADIWNPRLRVWLPPPSD